MVLNGKQVLITGGSLGVRVFAAWIVWAMTAVAAAGQPSITASINAPATLTCDAPGTATLTLTGQHAVSSAVDIMLVIDESSSVDAALFQMQRNFSGRLRIQCRWERMRQSSALSRWGPRHV